MWQMPRHLDRDVGTARLMAHVFVSHGSWSVDEMFFEPAIHGRLFVVGCKGLMQMPCYPAVWFENSTFFLVETGNPQEIRSA